MSWTTWSIPTSVMNRAWKIGVNSHARRLIGSAPGFAGTSGVCVGWTVALAARGRGTAGLRDAGRDHEHDEDEERDRREDGARARSSGGRSARASAGRPSHHGTGS